MEIVTSSGLRKRCRLLELPAELRLHIYKFALSDMPVIDARTRYFPRNTTYALYDGPVTSCILCDLPLLRLNRQIRDEAIPYLSPCTNVIPDTWTLFVCNKNSVSCYPFRDMTFDSRLYDDVRVFIHNIRTNIQDLLLYQLL